MDINAEVQDINIDVTVVQPNFSVDVSVGSAPNITVSPVIAQPIVVTPPNPNDNISAETGQPIEIDAINVGGPKGDTGPANELSIGSVTSGAEAGAYINGDVPRQVLNLVLPKGDKGDEGDQGIPGLPNVLSIGTVEKGDDASATITGLSPEQILNLVLPKGDKGNDGDPGDPGVAGRSVVSIIKTNTVGLVDIYTVTYSDSTTSSFDVTNGANGTNGVNGSTWHSGSGVPSSGLGVDGDYYFRVDTSGVYAKSGGSWSLLTTISNTDPNAVHKADTTLVGSSFFIDEDNMASNLDTKVPSQQSVKAYLDGAVSTINGLITSLTSRVSTLEGQVWVYGALPSGNNANNALTDGCYTFAPDTVNRPTGQAYGTIFTTVSTGRTGNNIDNWVNQLAFPTSGVIMYRQKVNAGAWSAWKTIAQS